MMETPKHFCGPNRKEQYFWVKFWAGVPWVSVGLVSEPLLPRKEKINRFKTCKMRLRGSETWLM